MSENATERDEIEDEIADLSALENLFSNRASAIRRAKDKLRKQALVYAPEHRIVTDHALLRFMERHKGIDVEGLRQELRSIAENTTPAKDGEHCWDAKSGVLLILGEAGQVITVLSPEQAEKWAGRKLKNGTRIDAALSEESA
jgi:hypothetical protein